MPTPLTDADKVLRNDTGIDIATNIASIASALTPSNITDLGDVNLTNPITDGQVIKYDTATQKWVNGLGNITMECTQAQYDAWKQSGQLKTNTLYVITDAPNLNETAKQISYDGGTATVYDVLNPTAYSTTGLSYTNCSYAAGGYCKIGSLVIVNMRIVVTGAIANGVDFMTGFPKPIDENTNMVQVSNNANNGFTLKKDGSLSNGSTGLSSGNAVLFSVAYLTRDE